MIQRIQSLYLFLAVILSAVAVFEPVFYVFQNDSLLGTVYNYAYRQPTGEWFFGSFVANVVLLAAAVIVAAYTIFAFKNRKKQMGLCRLASVLFVLYYLVLGVVCYAEGILLDVIPSIYAAFPLISLVLCMLARRGIVKDERLVRAADRIR